MNMKIVLAATTMMTVIMWYYKVRGKTSRKSE